MFAVVVPTAALVTAAMAMLVVSVLKIISAATGNGTTIVVFMSSFLLATV